MPEFRSPHAGHHFSGCPFPLRELWVRPISSTARCSRRPAPGSEFDAGGRSLPVGRAALLDASDIEGSFLGLPSLRLRWLAIVLGPWKMSLDAFVDFDMQGETTWWTSRS